MSLVNTIRRFNVSVLGSYSSSPREEEIAYELGSKLANLGVNLISGGQKGVMFHVCRGAYENRKNLESCSIVGLLPSNSREKANPYVDVVIPAGAAILQNAIVPLSGDVVIAIGGAAGTLTEISIAWQNKKPIGLLGEEGWASNLANKPLDNRRSDIMPYFACADDAVRWIVAELASLDRATRS